MKLTLTTDSAERKRIPLFSGLFGYFAAALVGVAKHSWLSNEKHNPGEPVHWSQRKSNDHAECLMRHSNDLGELLVAYDRATGLHQDSVQPGIRDDILATADAVAWRALAWSQMLHQRFDNAPLPFNATDGTEDGQ